MARWFRLLATVVISILCGALLPYAAQAATIYVDAANCPGPGNGSPSNPFCKIQAAINAALHGDTILVADGIYTGTGNKNLDFAGKAITLRSAGGNPAACIIDCEGSGRGFYFHTNETAAAVVEGFTIRNGRATSSTPGGTTGGGVYCSIANPTLTNCIISTNSASGTGPSVFGGVTLPPRTSPGGVLGLDAAWTKQGSSWDEEQEAHGGADYLY